VLTGGNANKFISNVSSLAGFAVTYLARTVAAAITA
jgi:hypothetical protein